ncbi:MAG: HD domain-containing protein [Planctomycetia bacterium]|nr:HD domain-containing protein [Planctomycetia bacterium]
MNLSALPDLPHIDSINLTYDAVHGYIPFTSNEGLQPGETSERMLIDHPWVQRLRQIHQLQTAWWVFPTAEHTRFQHVLGVMHLASKAVETLYESLREALPDENVPSRGYVEALMRISALLHDVGHGPFGHFFDQHFLANYDLNHEKLGGIIIQQELGDMIRGIRRTVRHSLATDETLSPEQVAFLIKRPARDEQQNSTQPRWLKFLRSLFCGIYTVDNMDFVLRDAFMSGYSQKSIDVERLLHYTRFTPAGLTIHDKGFSSLVRFIMVRAELFQTIYFHRTVRAIDLELEDLFRKSKDFLFPGNPVDNLQEYLYFTEWSLLMQVSQWRKSQDAHLRELSEAWNRVLTRHLRWRQVAQCTLQFSSSQPEGASIFARPETFELALRNLLPPAIKDIPLRFDVARHVFRPGSVAPAARQNFLYDSSTETIKELETEDLFRNIPQTFRICRVYAENDVYQREIGRAMDILCSRQGADDVTNV